MRFLYLKQSRLPEKKSYLCGPYVELGTRFSCLSGEKRSVFWLLFSAVSAVFALTSVGEGASSYAYIPNKVHVIIFSTVQ